MLLLCLSTEPGQGQARSLNFKLCLLTLQSLCFLSSQNLCGKQLWGSQFLLRGFCFQFRLKLGVLSSLLPRSSIFGWARWFTMQRLGGTLGKFALNSLCLCSPRAVWLEAALLPLKAQFCSFLPQLRVLAAAYRNQPSPESQLRSSEQSLLKSGQSTCPEHLAAQQSTSWTRPDPPPSERILSFSPLMLLPPRTSKQVPKFRVQAHWLFDDAFLQFWLWRCQIQPLGQLLSALALAEFHSLGLRESSWVLPALPCLLGELLRALLVSQQVGL